MTIGANPSPISRTVSFDLVARNGSSSYTAGFNIVMGARTPAAVLSVSASPSTLSPQGGQVTITGTVQHASTCRLELLSKQSFPVVYSDSQKSCTSGNFSAHVTVGANPSPVRRTVSFDLVARNGSSSFTAGFSVVVAVAAPPVVLSVSGAPSVLPPGGGQVTLTGTVEHATTCQLELLSSQSFPVVYSHDAKGCDAGSYSASVVIGANPSPIIRTVSFALLARNGTSSSTRRFYVTLAAPPPPTTTTTVVDLTIDTSSVPDGSVGVPYHSRLHASDGLPPYVWSAFVGMPPGLIVTSLGVITGTPTLGGDFEFTVTVEDSNGNQSSAGVPITISGGGTTTTVPAATTTTSTPGPAVQQFTSDNWSGYAVDGGPFTSVSGTFTVPYLTTDATCEDRLSDWVGINGWSPAGPTSSLIQAGVDESDVDPATGACNPSGSFYAWAWWEILPASSNPVYSVLLNGGDSITVTISQTGGTGLWTILLTDNTDGQSFTEQEPYSGTGSSAEWITEAFADNTCGSGVGPAPGFPGVAVCTIASYSDSSGNQPGVSFDNLAYNGNVTEIDEITMVQNGVSVSTPSNLGSNGLSGGFTMSYTGNEGSNLIGPLRTGRLVDEALDRVGVGLGTPARVHGTPYVDRPINSPRNRS
jgi:hypothetical protein